MECDLIFDDWRQFGNSESIYNTDLGVDLSMGALHSGTVFAAEVSLPDCPEIAAEIERAMQQHQAYPVFRLIPTRENKR